MTINETFPSFAINTRTKHCTNSSINITDTLLALSTISNNNNPISPHSVDYNTDPVVVNITSTVSVNGLNSF